MAPRAQPGVQGWRGPRCVNDICLEICQTDLRKLPLDAIPPCRTPSPAVSGTRLHEQLHNNI